MGVVKETGEGRRKEGGRKEGGRQAGRLEGKGGKGRREGFELEFEGVGVRAR